MSRRHWCERGWWRDEHGALTDDVCRVVALEAGRLDSFDAPATNERTSRTGVDTDQGLELTRR